MYIKLKLAIYSELISVALAVRVVQRQSLNMNTNTVLIMFTQYVLVLQVVP